MTNPEYKRLKEVIEMLRHPEKGCPWDLKQTHESLLKYLLEESYEFINAVENKDYDHMKEELGDILLQILLHAGIAGENGNFDMESVCATLADKMVHRHPHVFKAGEGKASVEEVLTNWDKLKEEEKGKKEREIDDSYLMFPPLHSAFKIGKKTQKIGFDWDDPVQVTYKVEEEWQELKEELLPSAVNKARVEEEFGDFLFSIVQLGRHLDIDSEKALRAANRKFIKRFNQMEDLMKDAGQKFLEMNQKQMDIYWDQAKKLEKEGV
ncbi:MAG: nucleoside triphosphate pyrophosphohydrolase [Epsilonproteobacteria bacterium]|nr:MAG: nucleoside triphosphate pyrophosphohydrolase [Campylobacterota bacterium]RLA66701.1 MAG: nucleoside triphosphate pyrophosphohydrolase [Campylobacterota bacterium]